MEQQDNKKQLKNILIRTTNQYREELISLLGNIPHKIHKGDGKGKIYEPIVVKYGLFPFDEPDNWKENNLKFVMDRQYLDQIKNIEGMVKSNGQLYSFRYKDTKQKFDITYNISADVKPKYPIYVVSYGRYALRDHTIDALQQMGVDYHICVQEREKELYEKHSKEYGWTGTIITSPNTDQGSSKQRNTCLEHSKQNGHKKFWLLDDNMTGWYYFNMLMITKINHPYVFTHLEDISDNIKEPVGIISHCYTLDVRANDLRNPLQVNTKNYSSSLIDTEICGDIRFRLQYNEDIDFTFQVLERGIKTIGLNIFLAGKKATKTVKGGNTDSIYKDVSDTDNKMHDKFNCLQETWKDTPIEMYIEKTNNYHADGRTHHKINWEKVSEAFQNTKTLTPIINKGKLTYDDLGISMVINQL